MTFELSILISFKNVNPIKLLEYVYLSENSASFMWNIHREVIFYVKIGYLDCEYNYFWLIYILNLPLSMAFETCFFFNSKSCSDFFITEALFWTWATFEAARSIFSQIVVWSTFIVLSCSLPYCGCKWRPNKVKTVFAKNSSFDPNLATWLVSTFNRIRRM